MGRFESYEDAYKDLVGRPDHDLHAYADHRGGGHLQNAAKVILEERRMEKLKSITPKEKRSYTLVEWFMLGSWSDRFGMISLFTFIFALGYLCARNKVFSSIMDLIIDTKP